MGASSSAGVSVKIINAPSLSLPGLVAVQVPRGMVAAGIGLVIALPESVTSLAQRTDLPVSVTLVNNQPLPAWIRYDAKTRSLVTDAAPATAFPLSLLVTVGDQRTLIQVSESQVTP